MNLQKSDKTAYVFWGGNPPPLGDFQHKHSLDLFLSSNHNKHKKGGKTPYIQYSVYFSLVLDWLNIDFFKFFSISKLISPNNTDLEFLTLSFALFDCNFGLIALSFFPAVATISATPLEFLSLL